jgi:ABC-type transport system substrate-binding protein
VRQALTSAINKDEIVHGVMLGMGQVAHGPYKPGTWGPAEASALTHDFEGWHDPVKES